MTGKQEHDDRYMVPGLHKGVQMLACFNRQKPRWTLSEIAARLNLPVSTAFRLAYTLQQAGLLERDAGAGKEYSLGLRALDLGSEYLASVDIVQIATPHLERLRQAHDLSTQLAVRVDTDILYVVRLSGQGPLNPDTFVGNRLPAHATTIGRVLLADLDSDELDRLYRGATLTKLTEKTPATLPALKAQLKKIRSLGYDFSEGGCYVAGLTSIATGLRGIAGNVEAAISLSGPSKSIPAHRWEGPIKRSLLKSAEAISRSLGHGAAGYVVNLSPYRG